MHESGDTAIKPQPLSPRTPDVRTGIVLLLTADWRPCRRFGIAATAFLVVVAITAALALHGLSVGDSDRWFHEGKWGTILNTVTLGVAAFFAFREAEWFPDEGVQPFWIGCGVLLAIASADDMLKIHEHVDRWIHGLLALERRGLKVSGLDDYLVLVYPAGVCVFALRSWRHVLAMTQLLR